MPKTWPRNFNEHQNLDSSTVPPDCWLLLDFYFWINPPQTLRNFLRRISWARKFLGGRNAVLCNHYSRGKRNFKNLVHYLNRLMSDSMSVPILKLQGWNLATAILQIRSDERYSVGRKFEMANPLLLAMCVRSRLRCVRFESKLSKLNFIATNPKSCNSCTRVLLH